jgi:hypothetical protein
MTMSGLAFKESFDDMSPSFEWNTIEIEAQGGAKGFYPES